jgi:hypothetical protein
MDYIYSSDGVPQAFRLSDYIYALDGTAIGKVFAEKAYRLDGTYVGAVINNMVVDRPDVSRRSLRPSPSPPNASLPQNIEGRRPIGESWPECFQDLLTGPDGSQLVEASASG